jgi:NADPH:quinone reductase
MIKTRRHRRGALLLMAAARAKNRRTRVRTARTRDSAVPKTMRAAAINRFGGPEVLSIHTLPTPKIGPREVLIALDTAGIGSWDGAMRGGWSPDGRRPRFPLVLGSDGAGVGTLAIQFAKLRGARVLAIASGPKGKVLARRLGADAVADGRTENIAVAAKRFAPKGIDAVLAFAGGQALERSLDTLRRGGKLAYPNGVEPKPWKRPGVKVVVYNGESGVREFKRLNDAVERAKLKVPLTDVFALAEAAKAHKRVAAGHILGKVVLRIKSRRG